MKKIVFIFVLLVSIGTIAYGQHKSLILNYEGHQSYGGIGTPEKKIPELHDEMVELIKKGYATLVIEGNDEIAWILLNDVSNPKDYTDGSSLASIESDYINLIQDLFPIKITKSLKRKLNRGINVFMTALGIEYVVDGDEVTTIVDYDKFEKYL